MIIRIDQEQQVKHFQRFYQFVSNFSFLYSNSIFIFDFNFLVHRGGNHRGIEQRIQHHSYYGNGNHFQRRTQYHQQQQQHRSTDPSS